MSGLHVPFLELRSAHDRTLINDAIRRVLDRGQYVLGPEVERFEAEFAAASGALHAVGVNSGTDALMLLLKAAGIGPGDEVITAALSSAFTAIAIANAGARPVFADINAESATIDPDAIEAAITPRTRAIVPVHIYGRPSNLPMIDAVARRRGLAVIEDCAQAHLATCSGRPVGTFGIGGAFSFYPTKNLGALGDAGAVVTNDAALADRIRRLRNGGQTERNRHVDCGVNSRLDELQAAVLRARLTQLAGYTARRQQLAATYRATLDPAVVALAPADDPGHVYHLFTVRSERRDALRAHLLTHGIATLVHYPVPVPRQPAFASSPAAPCPNAERFCAQVVSLPLYPNLTDDQVHHVSEAVNNFPRHEASYAFDCARNTSRHG
jgi:dTDP-3-amino-3,4,6-trideoxy-alpha-D-glucose transaminase